LFLSAVLAATFSTGGHACSCAGPDYFGGPDGWARAMLSEPGSGFAVHAQVESLLPGNSARIRVIENFKPGREVSEITGRGGNCGVWFRPGDEAIFITGSDPVVNLCGKFRPEPDLLQALRARTNSGTKGGGK
jgi:hypothetical protein